MKIDRQTKLILLQLIRPVIAVVLAAIAVHFISAQIVATSKQINEKRTLYATLERRTETVGSIEKDFELVGENAIEIMEHAFPPSNNILEFIVATEVLASKSLVAQLMTFGTPVQFIKNGVETSAVSVSSIDIGININGNASNVIKYFTGLEKLQYLTSVTNLQITSGAPAGWESAGNVVAKGKLYAKSAE